MLYLTLTERLALMRTPFAEVELQNLDGASAPTVLPDPFTSSPSRELIVVRDLFREKKLYPENFCGRAGAAVVLKDHRLFALLALEPVSESASKPYEKLSLADLWPPMSERAIKPIVMTNGRGEKKSLAERIEEIFEPYTDRSFHQGGKEQALRRALWRRVIAESLSSPSVRLVEYLNKNHPEWPLCALSEWWIGESPSWECRFDQTFYAPRSGARFWLEWMLLGRAHEKALPMQSEETAPAIGIVYEDDDMLVINKPARLGSVPGVRETVSAKSILEKTHGELFVVHRLDLDTSGILAFAKNKTALARMNDCFRGREAKKTYVARLEGELKHDSGDIALPLGLNWLDRPRQCIIPASCGGKNALTHYRLIDSIECGGMRKSIVELGLETGRTHQLRLHCAKGLNLPIDGDPFYGSMGLMAESGSTRLCLHAKSLSFVHPSTGKEMFFETPANFPEF